MNTLVVVIHRIIHHVALWVELGGRQPDRGYGNATRDRPLETVLLQEETGETVFHRIE